ncbi:hypothetical protein SDC9_122704 [bioreactor metagenome]|uniref:Uncharacterized protein n=1 Tax=bioreactor metagenome TaxID=1076179 RepID=A0A645CFK7_9ZZZZ
MQPPPGTADELRDEVVGGMGHDLLRRARLGDPGSGAQHQHLVAEQEGLVHVVRHEDHRLAQLGLDPQHLLLQVAPDDRIDRAERLVHQQDVGVGGQCPGHPDPLPLPTGQLRGVATRQGAGIETDQLEQLVGPAVRRTPVGALQQRDGRDIVGDGAVRQQAGALHHVPDPAPQGHRVEVGDVVVVDPHAPAGRVDHPVHHPQQGGLAATGRAQQHRDVVRGHLEGEVLDRNGAVGEALVDVVEPDHGSPVVECRQSSTQHRHQGLTAAGTGVMRECPTGARRSRDHDDPEMLRRLARWGP